MLDKINLHIYNYFIENTRFNNAVQFSEKFTPQKEAEMKRSILLLGTLIEYDLQKKKIKNVNIRVKGDMTVHVSAPVRVPQKQIDEILVSKAEFILSALAKYEKRQEICDAQSSDNCLRVLGKMLPITVSQGRKNQAIIADDCVKVILKDTEDTAAYQKAISTALDSLCRETVTEICREVYPHFEEYVSDFPSIKFRHMKSRWGSCTPKKKLLTFNYALIHAPREYIEYVVYHEFTHFLHPDHSKAFYLALSRYVPDYKDKKKQLAVIEIK